MLQILSQIEEDGFIITQYTNDGITISHTVIEVIPMELPPEGEI